MDTKKYSVAKYLEKILRLLVFYYFFYLIHD